MSEEYRAKVFKSGNSVALRLPKALGVVEGTEMVVREESGKFTFEPAPSIRDKIDLSGIWGAIPDFRPLTPEQRIMEPRDLDWDGKLLDRD